MLFYVGNFNKKGYLFKGSHQISKNSRQKLISIKKSVVKLDLENFFTVILSLIYH